MALTKSNIISRIINESGLTDKRSTEAVESIIEIIKSTLESGEDILFSGFGKFCVIEKSARKGRNPATGKDAMLPARKVVTFKCSGKLRDRINGVGVNVA
jgi:integration host factor subunit alpha